MRRREDKLVVKSLGSTWELQLKLSCVIGGEESGIPSVVVFFFQARDGIRGLVRSRGLGDVYKRQERNGVASAHTK